jgi:RNA polymerase sigma-70 factor (ECF subfamily)
LKGSGLPVTSLSKRAGLAPGEEGAAAQPLEQQSKPLDLGELYRLYARSVARWAYLLGGPKMDAEDIMQEVFLVAHRQLPQLLSQEHVAVWLHRVTRNVVRNRRRKDRAREVLHDLMGRTSANPEPGIDDRLLRDQTHARVYRILDRMKENYRTVLILFELEDLSGEELTKVLDVKLPTVWVWLHRARRDFLARLQAEAERD